MLALGQISATHWVFFIGAVLFFLALDLGVFHRKARLVRFKEALGWTVVWFCLAMLFAAVVAPAMVPRWGRQDRVEFITGYITELSLSMDNVFVIALIFSYFRVPGEFQHRVLFWGILGALIMRGIMIWLGWELIQRFHATLYLFGVFLVITGAKMLVSKEQEVHPEHNLVLRLAQKLFPVTTEFQGQKFVVRRESRLFLTPLALVLLMVETTDLIFALDSIPAIFGVTQQPFVIFTSNVFAILGLRSLYFVLANAIDYFRYLKAGLSLVLVFIGAKMLLPLVYEQIPVLRRLGLVDEEGEISTELSLGIVASIILLSILVSVLAAKREGHGGGGAGAPPAA